MRDWIPDPWLETNESYNEFWTFAAELPNKAIDLATWQSMFAVLYDRRLQNDQNEPIRSNELIYRSWDRMEGHPSKQFYCGEFQALLDGGNETAHQLLFTSDGESQFILLADRENPNPNRVTPANPGWDRKTTIRQHSLVRNHDTSFVFQNRLHLIDSA